MNRKTLIIVPIALLIAALVAVACGGGAPTVPPAATVPPPAAGATEQPAATAATTEQATTQPDTAMSDLDKVFITTSSNNVVGIGSYVAAEAYGIAAGADPKAQPAQALIMPFAITPDMQVADITKFDPSKYAYRIRQQGFTAKWDLKAPDGSKAALTDHDGVQVFLADIKGAYTLSLTMTDSKNNSGTASWDVSAGTYIGVGPLDGSAKPPNCAACHQDRAVNEWAKTKHASMFTLAIDGKKSDHYGPNCISCHTTGFNNRPEAAGNGGFFDVASQKGWKFPGTLKDGNWAAMQQNFPAAAALANIQCENCHGPGSAHFTGDPTKMGPIAESFEYGACAQCHAEGPYHVVPQQWETSAHAVKDAQAFWYPIGENRQACARCHSGVGYVEFTQGEPQDQWQSVYQPITCAVCHDPHNATNPNQLRTYDTVTTPAGLKIDKAGPAATCMACHNDRVDAVKAVEGNPVAVTSGANKGLFQLASVPHYSTATELLQNSGGYTWGQTLPGSPHGQMVENTCVGCHMAATPGSDQTDPAKAAATPGNNTVGGHTFAMVDAKGVENIAVCQKCHSGAQNFEFTAKADYDGDGKVDSNPDEVKGLLALLQKDLEAKGVKISGDHPYVFLPAGASVDVRGAAFNFKFVMGKMGDLTDYGKSASIHNFRYVVSLLQLSIEKLTGQPVPNAARP